jgi:hypothetical protein
MTCFFHVRSVGLLDVGVASGVLQLSVVSAFTWTRPLRA